MNQTSEPVPMSRNESEWIERIHLSTRRSKLGTESGADRLVVGATRTIVGSNDGTQEIMAGIRVTQKSKNYNGVNLCCLVCSLSVLCLFRAAAYSFGFMCRDDYVSQGFPGTAQGGANVAHSYTKILKNEWYNNAPLIHRLKHLGMSGTIMPH